jgi:predicted nucleic acid-binding protein
VIIVDSSALIDHLLGAGRVVALEQDDLHAPQICDLEVASAFGRLLRTGIIAERQAAELLTLYAALPLRLHGHRPLLARCVTLRANFSAYDAAYVALAERLGSPFLTRDRRLARAVRRHVPAVELVG